MPATHASSITRLQEDEDDEDYDDLDEDEYGDEDDEDKDEDDDEESWRVGGGQLHALPNVGPCCRNVRHAEG
jgi:hypothetical protein